MPSIPSRPVRVATAAAGAGVTAGAAILAWGALVGARRLKVREEEVGVEAPGAPRLRVAHLSDLHLGRIGRAHRAAARAVNAFEPHLVALTGDFLQRRRGLLTLDAFLGLLDPAPALVAVAGNWDHGAGVVATGLERVLADHGGALLLNGHRTLEVEGRAVLVTGLDDPVKGRPDLVAALAGAPSPDLHLLLVHAPAWRDSMGDAMDALARHGGDPRARGLRPHLILSGHTHGGQVRLGGLAWTPRGSGRYLRGWYRDGPVAMFVSPGVGTVVPVRVGAPPEVGLFTIVPPPRPG
ncbi:MAG: metallophosphoesterase family protein [Gemmatimonadetes bacterium]|nr:metallophosphoesterase family protein [Gemmatimonadota bacterium]